MPNQSGLATLRTTSNRGNWRGLHRNCLKGFRTTMIHGETGWIPVHEVSPYWDSSFTSLQVRLRQRVSLKSNTPYCSKLSSDFRPQLEVNYYLPPVLLRYETTIQFRPRS